MNQREALLAEKKLVELLKARMPDEPVHPDWFPEPFTPAEALTAIEQGSDFGRRLIVAHHNFLKAIVSLMRDANSPSSPKH